MKILKFDISREFFHCCRFSRLVENGKSLTINSFLIHNELYIFTSCDSFLTFSSISRELGSLDRLVSHIKHYVNSDLGMWKMLSFLPRTKFSIFFKHSCHFFRSLLFLPGTENKNLRHYLKKLKPQKLLLTWFFTTFDIHNLWRTFFSCWKL